MPDPDAHVRHADSHGRPWPIGSWYCCGAVQLGVIGPDDCNECGEPWPCPSVIPPEAGDTDVPQ